MRDYDSPAFNAAVVSASRDLEDDVCKLVHMAALATSYIERAFEFAPGRSDVAISKPKAEVLIFAVYQIEAMAATLKEKYYAALDGKSLADDPEGN